MSGVENGGKNRQVILARRPAERLPSQDDFRVIDAELAPLGENEVMVKTEWLSIEPYMRAGMNGRILQSIQDEGDRWSGSRLGWIAACIQQGVEIGEVMQGTTVGSVVQSRNPRFREGDTVLGYGGWQQYHVDDGRRLRVLKTDGIPARAALGVLGVPGMTAYAGMKDIGYPAAGQTVVVSAALGAVGSVAAQIALIAGARTVGIASGQEKCRYLVEQLGLDSAVDRKSPDFPDALRAACPNGIDLYVENGGSSTFQAAFPLLNERARVQILGMISGYSRVNSTVDMGPDNREALQGSDIALAVQMKRLTMKGTYWFERIELEDEFVDDVTTWIEAGSFQYREHVVENVENAPQALIDVLSGRNLGKMLVRV